VQRRSTREHEPAGREARATAGGGPLELRERVDADPPADQLERLAHVDALLRFAAARDPRPTAVYPCTAHGLRLSFGELALIYKSLHAVKTLGALPQQDELLNDTIQLVDQALARARRLPEPAKAVVLLPYCGR
jgi:hypothetical protein